MAAVLLWLVVVVAVFVLGSLPRSYVATRACNSWGEPQNLVLEDVTTSTPGTARRPGPAGSCTFVSPDGSPVFIGLDEIPKPIAYDVVNGATVIIGGMVVIGAGFFIARRA